MAADPMASLDEKKAAILLGNETHWSRLSPILKL